MIVYIVILWIDMTLKIQIPGLHSEMYLHSSCWSLEWDASNNLALQKKILEGYVVILPLLW